MDIYALTDKAILVQVGLKLKEIRIEKNISQGELAKASGLSAFSISQMENGHNTSILSLVMVLRALNKLEILDEILKDKPISPIALSEYAKKHPKKNHASKSKKVAETTDFNWDNE